jgi:type VI secretion system protein ImpH
MATEEREPADLVKLARALLEQASRTEFFTFVPLVERLTSSAIRVGGDGPPQKEALRFRHDPSMGFSASDISSGALIERRVRAGEDGDGARIAIELTTTFLGLSGSSSPLPLYIPAEIAQNNAGQNLQAHFLDIFHHRLLSLLYRLFVRYESAREFTSDANDPWSQRLLTLASPAHVSHDRPSRIARHKLLALAPLLSMRARTARGLELALEEILELPPGHVRVRHFVGGFVRLDDSERMRLLRPTAVLGRSAILGSHAYARASRFAIELGPVSASEYPRYVDKGERAELLREVVELMVREPLDYDVDLLLGDDALPGFPLAARRGAPLGVATRLRASGAKQRIKLRDFGRRIPA